jgi:anti-sigma regulatory factor (Ser/Thr protein kinase)
VENAQFGGTPTSSAAARHLVSETLDRWELPRLKEDAELLTGELVNNAIGHATTDLALVVAMGEGSLEIGVTDFDPHTTPLVKPKFGRMDITAKDQVLAEDGRGLLLVDLLAEEWGVVGLERGKQVWFRLSTNDWPYNEACPCHDPERVRLESGRYVMSVAGPWDNTSGPI